MRFCDLFISYKLGLKETKSSIPFTKLPLYRKVFLVLFLSGFIISGILLIFIQNLFSFIPAVLSIISFLAFLIVDSLKRNTMAMLKDHYIHYSEKRMNMVIEILKNYNIDINKLHLLDMLIDEAKLAQVQCDYLFPLRKPLKTLSAIIIPIIVSVAKKICDTASQSETIYMATGTIILILLIFSLIFSLTPIAKDLLYRDYRKYDELVYDLRQIKLFYSKTNQ